MKLLVTGASGFVGSVLCPMARAQGMSVLECRRSPAQDSDVESVQVDLLTTQDWMPALQGVNVVVHLAARVHQMHERFGQPEAAYREINVEASRCLIEQAARAGVRRFVFVSSIKVNGECSSGRPLTENDDPRPVEPYARSKHEAEQLLRALAESYGMEWVIVRPPLVFGAGVKGNFERLLRLVRGGAPLPAAPARRSYINVWNLADLILLVCTHSAAANQIFLARDVTWTTAELVRQIAAAMKRPPLLVPLPAWLARLLARLPRIGGIFVRLCGELEVSADKARQRLGWSPPVSAEEAIARTVACFNAGPAGVKVSKCC